MNPKRTHSTIFVAVRNLIVRLYPLLGLLMCLPLGLYAQGTGSITGRVLNQGTQGYLGHAEVRVQGTNLVALTDSDGSYRLSGVPAGENTVIVSYPELNDGKNSIVVTEGKTTQADFSLGSEVYRLGAFVVSTEREGNADALNQQKQGASYRNVASADAFGDISFGNPGDLLKNLPGVQMDYVGSDPRTIRLRGMDPNLTLVTLDGNQMASAASSGTNRNFEIDQTSIASIESVEVFKAPIPSMPANAIGGTVNFVSKSAFEQKGRRTRLTVGLNADSYQLNFDKSPGPNKSPARKILPRYGLSYSESFLSNRLGVAVNINNSKVWYPLYQADNTFTYVAPLPVFPAPYTKDNPRARRGVYTAFINQQYIVRNSYSANFDFKLIDSLSFYLRNSFTDYYTMNRSLQFRLRANTVAADFTATDVTALAQTGTTTSNAEFTTSFHDKYSRSWAINPGVRFRSGDWRAEFNNGFSTAVNRYKYPDFFNVVNMQLAGVGFKMTTPEGTSVPSSLIQTSGPDFYNVANYRPQSPFVSNNERNAKDVVISSQFHVRKNFSAKFPFYIEAGGSYLFNQRKRNQPQRQWSYTGPTDSATMALFADTSGVKFGFGQQTPIIVSPWKVYDYFAAHPTSFVENLPFNYEQEITQRLLLDEAVTAGYAMSKVSFGNLDVLFGARVEATDLKAQGPKLQASKVPTGVDPNSLAGMMAKYSRTTAHSGYTSDPFKYLHLTYHATRDWQMRASYTEAIGRPNFASVFPSLSINDTTRVVTANNTELRPQQSKNYDVSAEYYMQPAGMVTVAWFKRDVLDYISTSSSVINEANPDLNIGSELIGYQLNTQRNFGYAKWEGIEGSYRLQLRQFKSAPNVLRGLEFFGTYTHLYRMRGDYGGATLITQLANVSPRLWSAGLSYRTPNGKFYFNFKSVYASAWLLSNTGAAAQNTQKRDPDFRHDAEMRYRTSAKTELVLTGRNLSNITQDQSEVGRTTRIINDSGVWYSLALNIDL